MDHIATNLSVSRLALTEKKRVTERGELLQTFLSGLNPGRKAKGYEPLTYGRLAYMLAGIDTKDLYALLSKCNDAERRGYPGVRYSGRIAA